MIAGPSKWPKAIDKTKIPYSVCGMAGASLKIIRHNENILSEQINQVLKGTFPELSKSMSPPAEPGVYSGEIIKDSPC